jgi:hypothetical protein
LVYLPFNHLKRLLARGGGGRTLMCPIERPSLCHSPQPTVVHYPSFSSSEDGDRSVLRNVEAFSVADDGQWPKYQSGILQHAIVSMFERWKRYLSLSHPLWTLQCVLNTVSWFYKLEGWTERSRTCLAVIAAVRLLSYFW